MNQLKLFILLSLLALAGCGKGPVQICLLVNPACKETSKIDVRTPPVRLAETYGDGKYITSPLVFPITDSALAYTTPIPGLGPIIGGVVKFVGNVFASSTNMGKLQMNYTQAIPEIPDALHSLKLKRLFFYMKPPKTQRRWPWIDEVILGRGSVTFDFLRLLAIRLNTVKLKNPDSYTSVFVMKDYNKEDSRDIMEVFEKNYRPEIVDTDTAREINLIRYKEKEKDKDTVADRYGDIYIMETVMPLDTAKLLERHPKMKGMTERILLLDNSILVELKNDPVIAESFRLNLQDLSEDLDKLKVTYIDTCTPNSCIQFTVPDVNLVPILKKGNAIKLDGVLHADKVPETFSLKGFVEFEAKIDSPI